MKKRTLDRGTAFGVVLAVTAVIGGLLLDGGSIRQILQPSAAMIVLLGTLAAVMIQFPLDTVFEAGKEVSRTLFTTARSSEDLVDSLVSICNQIRRQGMLTLDSKLSDMEDAFTRKGFTLAVDGVAARDIRDTLEVDLALLEEHEEGLVCVVEAAGGFAPTLGIVGAVLGLIQVMQRMDNVADVGKGIAVAFVSTLYGIGSANLCFLPLAGRLRIRMRQKQALREVTLEAILLMVQGVGAQTLRQRLESCAEETKHAAAALPVPELASR